MERRIDLTEVKFSQAGVAALTVVAYILDTAYGGQWLVLAVAMVLGLGAARPGAAVFGQLYARVLRPIGVLTSHVIAPEDPMAHRFAQGAGAAFLIAAFAFLIADRLVAGWVLSWAVTAAALLDVLFGFCAGCALYRLLDRRRLLPRTTGSKRAG